MTDPIRLAREINPDAGAYRITAEPRAVAACDAATARSYAEFPYWEARFAERGRRFSATDGAWLVRTSDDDDQDHVTGQVVWLGTVLSSRGMPRILLERHLDVLAEELERARPDHQGPARLRAAAESLRADRTAVIPAGRFDELARRFDERTADLPGAVPHCGPILVSAVCDDAQLASTVGALFDWLADPERFGPEWISAVEETLQAAYDARG
ncbi:hypothetical protein GCM10027418_27940 [Mariniluteicoccus endophyticus]